MGPDPPLQASRCGTVGTKIPEKTFFKKESFNAIEKNFEDYPNSNPRSYQKKWPMSLASR